MLSVRHNSIHHRHISTRYLHTLALTRQNVFLYYVFSLIKSNSLLYRKFAGMIDRASIKNGKKTNMTSSWGELPGYESKRDIPITGLFIDRNARSSFTLCTIKYLLISRICNKAGVSFNIWNCALKTGVSTNPMEIILNKKKTLCSSTCFLSFILFNIRAELLHNHFFFWSNAKPHNKG